MPEVKDIPLQWVRVNFRRHADKAQDEIAPETTLAPVDWYEDLDSNLKIKYNQKLLEKIIPTFKNIFSLTPEEEISFREKYKNTDFTGLIKSPTAEHEFHKHLLNFIVDTIGDYRFEDYKEKMGIKEDIDWDKEKEDLYQRKVKSWALYSNSILERIFSKIEDEHELDAKWNELSRQAISDDNQFAIDYFYNYRKMQLGLDYNDELIGAMEIQQTQKQLQEAIVVKGFQKTDYRSQALDNMDKLVDTFEYFKKLRDIKSFNDDALNYKIAELLDDTVVKNLKDNMISLSDYLETLPNKEEVKGPIGFREDEIKFSKKEMAKLHKKGKLKKDVDLKFKFKESNDIRLKNYKPLSEMDLDRTWSDTFGKEKGDRLAKKQKDLINDPVLMKARAAKVRHEKEKEEEKMRDRRWGKTDRERQQYRWELQDELDDLKAQQKQMYIDMEQEAEPEGGEIADRYGSDLNDIEAKIDIISAELEEMGLFESVNEETLKGAIEKEMKDNKGKFKTSFPTRDLRQILNTENPEDLPNSIKKVLNRLKKKYKIEESVNEVLIGPFSFNNNTSDEKLQQMYDEALNGYAYWQKGFEYPKSKYKQAYQAIEKLAKKKDIKLESVNEAKEYYVTYNRGRGQGKGLINISDTNKPKVFKSYKDAEKWVKAMSGGPSMVAYWVSDKDMNSITK